MSDQPQPGDTVRVSYETVWEKPGGTVDEPGPGHVVLGTHLPGRYVLEKHDPLREVTVEVVKRKPSPPPGPGTRLRSRETATEYVVLTEGRLIRLYDGRVLGARFGPNWEDTHELID